MSPCPTCVERQATLGDPSESRWIGPDGPVGDLEVFDLAGRRIARVPASGVGAWRWSPAAGTRRGVYFLKAPGARPVAAYFR